MKILILGGSGYIGKRLFDALKTTAWALPVMASRKKVSSSTLMGHVAIQINTLDESALTAALKDFDAVVNCVAGDGRSISDGAHVLVQAALAAKCKRIVHLSTMSVYGLAEGSVDEGAPSDPRAGWYGKAKIEAEGHIKEFVAQGGQAAVLRPGCVFGPGSELWVGRVGRWLQAKRLGDLGISGDGWSNLVHVDDICQAIALALQLKVMPGELPTFNLAAPDSPRWNDYFIDLALNIQAVPVQRIGQRQLQLDAFLISPPLKVLQQALTRFGKSKAILPDPLPPGLLRLFSQHIYLDSALAIKNLGLAWTPYSTSLKNSVDWFYETHVRSGQVSDKALYST